MSGAHDTPPSGDKSPADTAPAAAGTGHGHGPPPGEEPRWLDDPAHVKTMIRVFWASCALLLIPDVLEGLGVTHFKHPHEGFWWESWVGFFAFYGFAACVVLVLIAKQIRKVIMRDEDYYDE